MNDLLEWLALYLTPGLGVRSWQKLLDVFEHPRKVFQADRETIRQRVPGVSAKIIAAIDQKRLYSAAEQELEKAREKGVTIIPQYHPAYPELLRNIHDPPILLYVKGDPALLSTVGLGVVGARASSLYGQRVAEDLAKRLCLRGLAVISGLALGIDTAAHKGALIGGGVTVAVLGCGLDVVYPRQNRALYEQIASKGVLVSEYKFGTKPDAFRFPARNRLISGLSLGVVVVEAARKSGSLITARFALEQGREVFAIPGRIDSIKSEGVHRLLQEGAKLVHTIEDIVEELPCTAPVHGAQSDSSENDEEKMALSDAEEQLFGFLDVYPQTIDEITQRSGIAVHKVNELLLMLELKGLVESLAGSRYQKKIKKF